MCRADGTQNLFYVYLPPNKFGGYNINRPYRTFNPIFALLSVVLHFKQSHSENRDDSVFLRIYLNGIKTALLNKNLP